MAFENYTLATKVDPNNRFTETATSITIAGLLRNEDAFMYWDKGVAHFASDFTHHVKMNVNSSSDTVGFCTAWMLANAIGEPIALRAAIEDIYYITLTDTSTNAQITLIEFDNNTAYTDTNNTLSLDTDYWLEIERDETVGSFGTLYLRIYSDSGRTTLVDTLTQI